MVAVTVGGLVAAGLLSKRPLGQQHFAGLPVWRWFLLLGCTPSVW
jgi:hypothetical protein